jgi:hypothetical protein
MEYNSDLLKKITYSFFFSLILASVLFYKLETNNKKNDIMIDQKSKNSTLGASTLNGDPQVRPAIEWLSDEEFAVYRGCGTECEVVYIFNTKHDAQQKLFYGIKHTWSPDKKYVLAYHYALQPGVTVGDKHGAILLDLRREYSQESVGMPQATWSPDSSKLAVIIRKQDEEKLELLIYDVATQFKLLYQYNLSGVDTSDLMWASDDTVTWTEEGVSKSQSQ